MTAGEDLAAILAARPGTAPLDPPIRNALRVSHTTVTVTGSAAPTYDAWMTEPGLVALTKR